MKKEIALINKFPLQWEKGLKEVCSELEYNLTIFRDLDSFNPYKYNAIIFAWADKHLQRYLELWSKKNQKVYAFIRGYEAFNPLIEEINWASLDGVFFVNEATKDAIKKQYGIDGSVLYNPLYLSDFRYKEKYTQQELKRVAMICSINHKKNLPLAMQVMSFLNNLWFRSADSFENWVDFELHIAGAFQCMRTLMYLCDSAEKMRVRVNFYGHVKEIDEWINDKGIILSTSMTEGCPSGVFEAMAKGLKPIIHSFPGAEHIFPKSCLFSKLNDIFGILNDETNYRDFAIDFAKTSKAKWKSFLEGC
jgi:glycosyltransferase involved in cell wall biosynthesis